MTFTLASGIAACIAAFGIGYAGGSTIRVMRKAVESLD